MEVTFADNFLMNILTCVMVIVAFYSIALIAYSVGTLFRTFKKDDKANEK